MRFRILTLIVLGVVLGAIAPEPSHAKKNFDPWNIFNDPLLWFTKDPIVKYDDLPKNGSLPEAKTYSAHAWAQYRGGFAWRPNTANNSPKSKDVYYEVMNKEGDKEKILKMSQSELAALSPAEKLSLINCDYSFKLASDEKKECEKYMSDARAEIEAAEKSGKSANLKYIPNNTQGYCNHAAELPLFFEEPKNSVIQQDPKQPGCDGLSIPVSSADLKAMGMMALKKTNSARKKDFLGEVCSSGADEEGRVCFSCATDKVTSSNTDDLIKRRFQDKIDKYVNNYGLTREEKEYFTQHPCSDLNPGSMQVLLGNTVGKGLPLIMDRDADSVTWNRTIRSYETKELKTGGYHRIQPPRKCPSEEAKLKNPKLPCPASGTVYEMPVRTSINIIMNTDSNMSNPGGTQPTTSSTITLDYYLEINAKGEIIGGSWISDKHPDTFWRPAPDDSNGEALLTGDFEKLKGYLIPASKGAAPLQQNPAQK